MDLATRLVEQGARIFASVAAGRRPALPDPFTAGLIADALRQTAKLPDPEDAPAAEIPAGNDYGKRTNISRLYELFRNNKGPGLRPRQVATLLGIAPGSIGFYMNQGVAERQLSRDNGVYTWAGGKGGGDPSRGGTSKGAATRRTLIDVLKKFPNEGVGIKEINKASDLSMSQIHKQLKYLIGMKQVRKAGLKYVLVAPHEVVPEPEFQRRARTDKADRVIEALKAEPEKVFTSKQLMKIAGYSSDGGAFNKMRNDLIRDGRLEKLVMGQYRLGPKGG